MVETRANLQAEAKGASDNLNTSLKEKRLTIRQNG